MARNEEKAQSMLARFRANKRLELEGEAERRPYLATECSDVKQCERWRNQIIKEVAKGIATIQNAGLGEYRIRDLNDEINKKMREKRHWEDRILDLGGPNYRKIGPKMLDNDGQAVPGNPGYRYYGASRDLPGVREMLGEAEKAPEKRRLRGKLFTHIDADYYGYRDEEDGILVQLEAEAEALSIEQAMAEWEAKRAVAAQGQEATKGQDGEDEDEDMYAEGAAADLAERDAEKMEMDDDDGIDTHVEVPTMEDMEKLLLQRKKAMLLAQYASAEMQEDTATTKNLKGLN